MAVVSILLPGLIRNVSRSEALPGVLLGAAGTLACLILMFVGVYGSISGLERAVKELQDERDYPSAKRPARRQRRVMRPIGKTRSARSAGRAGPKREQDADFDD